MKKLFTIFIILLVISGCDGGGNGSSGTAPVITDAYLTDGNGNWKAVFSIGDEANVRIFATDPDLDMETIYLTEFYPAESNKIFNGPDSGGLPSQSETEMLYFFLENQEVVGPAGSYRLEFRIEDSKGNMSKVFKFYYIAK